MLFLYNTVIRLYTLLVRLVSFKNEKAKAWIEGRKDLLKHIEKKIDKNVQYTWFHFASLGEFEQGRSVLEQLKIKQPDAHILITFFSPSGYQVRKNYALADHVFYLPIDTSKNAKEFIRLVNPKLAIFTKYEYWYHFFKELNHQKIPLYVISGIFRKNQPFFKWYGTLHREMLKCVSHFFVQNTESQILLKGLNINNATISGDTRFDRVAQNAVLPKSYSEIEAFCENYQVIIAGSTWPEDEVLIGELVKQYPDWKLIIAPHEITEGKIASLEKILSGNTIRYSALDLMKSEIRNLKSEAGSLKIEKLQVPQTLIIDNIGMLSSLYQYGHIAYIGGGFGAGIHNTLEAAAFGLPIIFGPNYKKFKEAKDLIEVHGAFSVKDLSELKSSASKLIDENLIAEAGKAAKNYVDNNTGATSIILQQILT